MLRENFGANNLKSLKFDIPLMALTATATIQVREDILKSLHMSKGTKIVLTSFFRPNLRFSVSFSLFQCGFQEMFLEMTCLGIAFGRDIHFMKDIQSNLKWIGFL